MLATITTACQKSQAIESTSKTSVSNDLKGRINSENPIVFESVEEIVEYFDGMYENGDFITISRKDVNQFIIVDEGNEISLVSGITNPTTAQKHFIESDSKIGFAKAYNKYLMQDDALCLKVGYDKATKTYWADIIKC